MDFSLEIDNITYREQTHDLQYEVAQLREWKERAIKYMQRSAPKRNKINKEYAAMSNLQHKIAHMMHDIGSRSSIDTEMHLLKDQVEDLNLRNIKLQESLTTSSSKLDASKKDCKKSAKSNKELTSVLHEFVTAAEDFRGEGSEDHQNIIFRAKDATKWLRSTAKTRNDDENSSGNIITKEEDLQRALGTIEDLRSNVSLLEAQIQSLKQEVLIEKGVSGQLEEAIATHEEAQEELSTQVKASVAQEEKATKALKSLAKDAKKYVALISAEWKKKSGKDMEIPKSTNAALQKRFLAAIKSHGSSRHY